MTSCGKNHPLIYLLAGSPDYLPPAQAKPLLESNGFWVLDLTSFNVAIPARAGYWKMAAYTEGLVMNSSNRTSDLQHIEAENFISRYEAKYKREAKKFEKRLGIKHMQALNAAAKKFGMERHHYFLERIESLKSRAHHFATQEERIRCATVVQPAKDQNYYWFHAALGLDDDGDLMARSVACCKTTWLGFVGEDTTREIRKGALVNPDRVQDMCKGRRHSLYVIDDIGALSLWIIAWGGFALVPEDLVAESDFLTDLIAPQEYPPNSP
ncbi:hypothetical protein [Paraburkholderia terricola]|uniref:hypothetical protein n=1 Tax=Paraburkholderia terricola TaxID=169427 RepID=UPI001FD37B38|nr:hypothetical protein [Paraburkholderia terricola]